MMLKLTALVALAALLACAEEKRESFTPYSLGQALVIGPDKGGRHSALDQACDGASAECGAAVDSCGDDAYADVVLDEQHDVLDVLCYPGNATVREVGIDPAARVWPE